MDGVSYAVWNANNAGGDHDMSVLRMNDMLETILRVDADIVYVCELACKGMHEARLEQERLEEISARLVPFGYKASLISNYTDDPQRRDPSYQAMFSRIGGELATRDFGPRNGLTLHLGQQALAFVGVHLPDQRDEDRVEMISNAVAGSPATMHAIEAAVQRILDGSEESLPIYGKVIGGDLNTADVGNLLSRPLWLLGKLGVGNITVPGQYDDSKRVQRLLGFLTRAAGMGAGEARAYLESRGYHQANTRHIPTCSHNGYVLPLDDIYGNQGVVFNNTEIHQVRGTLGYSISDHKPVSTMISLNR